VGFVGGIDAHYTRNRFLQLLWREINRGVRREIKGRRRLSSRERKTGTAGGRRRLRQAGPTAGGGRGRARAGRGGPEGVREREEMMGRKWPKEREGDLFYFFFLIKTEKDYCCVKIIYNALKIQVKIV
jgi:hypothetical protein